jgi:hypothetical protein
MTWTKDAKFIISPTLPITEKQQAEIVKTIKALFSVEDNGGCVVLKVPVNIYALRKDNMNG